MVATPAATPAAAAACPRCGTAAGGQLHQRVSRHGEFWGCNRYPQCRYTQDQLPRAGISGAGTASTSPAALEMGERLAHISRLHNRRSQGTAQAPRAQQQQRRQPEYLPRWVPQAGASSGARVTAAATAVAGAVGEDPDLLWGGLDDAALAAVDLDVLVAPAGRDRAVDSRSGCKRKQPPQQTNQRALPTQESGSSSSTTTATTADTADHCAEFLSDEVLAQVDLGALGQRALPTQESGSSSSSSTTTATTADTADHCAEFLSDEVLAQVDLDALGADGATEAIRSSSSSSSSSMPAPAAAVLGRESSDEGICTSPELSPADAVDTRDATDGTTTEDFTDDEDEKEMARLFAEEAARKAAHTTGGVSTPQREADPQLELQRPAKRHREGEGLNNKGAQRNLTGMGQSTSEAARVADSGRDVASTSSPLGLVGRIASGLRDFAHGGVCY
jgi:hypothetical protein